MIERVLEAPATPILTAKERVAQMTPEQREAAYLELLAVSARLDGVEAVCDFGELVFGKVAARHHRAWLKAMLEGRRTVVVAPPESAKTTWATIIKTAWKIGKWPEKSWGIGTAGDNAADDMTKAVADTIEFNPRWKMAFPHVVPDKQRGWSSEGYHVRRTDLPDGEWERLRYGDKNPSLVGGGVGSARWNGLRLTGGLSLDDIHDRRSKTQQKTNDDTVGFVLDTAEFRVTADASLDVAQTRWNPKDYVSRAKARSDFIVFEHPAISLDAEGNERSYWPEYHPLEKLQAIRERSPIDFELVFQGNDRAVEGSVLKLEWLHDFPFLQFQKTWNRYFGIDFARRLREIEKKGDDPDSFALAVFADTGTRMVLEDCFVEELFAGDAEALFFAKAAIFRPLATGLEVNGASAKIFYAALLQRMRENGLNYVVVPVTRSKDKGEYLSEMAPYFSSGQVMVSDQPTPGLLTFRSQWVMFPRGHDDALDAAYNGWHVSSHLLPVPKAAYRERVARPNPFAAFGQQRV